MSVTTVTATGSCIHGIVYSSDYSCMACDQTLREMQPVFVETPVWSRENVAELNRKLNRIIALLEMIARVTR